MCLETVSLKKPEPAGYGYKVFRKIDRCLFSEFFPTRQKTRMWIGAKWVERSTASTVTRTLCYSPTWHILTNLEDARRWARCAGMGITGKTTFVVRRVKYNGAHTQGFQHRSPVIIANALYIYPGEV